MLATSLPVASFGIFQASALIAVIGAIAAAIVAVWKLGPERGALFITSAQGAAVIMDSLIETLRVEVDRCRAEITRLEAENERLEAENEQLRRRGDRSDDRPGA